MHDRPHDDALLALLYDELPPGEADALREKLAAESPESLERLTQWQAIRDVVAELPELEPDPQIHYDIIREARRAVAAEEKPSRLWAWLEQLTLMPALAGLLLVVLAAGLTVRMTTDLEQADDSALAPAETARPAGSAAPLGEEKKGAAPARKDTETVVGLDRPADQKVASKAAEEKGPTAATKTAPPVPQVEAEPAPEGDARGGLLDGIEGKAALDEAAKPIEAKGGAAKGAGRAAGKKALAAARESASKKSKAKPRKSRRKAPLAKGRKALDGLAFDDAAPQAPAAEPAPPEPAPDPAPTQAAAANAPVDDLFAGAAVTEAKAAEDSERREALGDARSADQNRDRGRAATRQPARAETAPGEPAANAPAGGAAVESTRGYAPPPPATVSDADEVAAVPADKAEEAEEAPAVQADGRAVALGGDVDVPADAPDDAAGDMEQQADGADRLSRARLLRARGLHREAVSEFEAFLSESRGSSGLDRVWFEAAESYRALGQEQRALQLYRLVAGGETTYADRARDRIASITGQNAGPGKAAGQAAPARARPAAAPEEADALELRE